MDLLSPTVLVRAYRAGLFPMADPDQGGRIGLYRADPRAVLPIEGFRIPRSVARGIRRRGYEIRLDAAFPEVVRACAAGRRDGIWLTEELAGAYLELHRTGIAHSVESWERGRLVGGLFGVAIGGLFTSESMFHRAPDAGSHALVGTAAHLASRGYALWDIQVASAHTERFGAMVIEADEYGRRLADALALDRAFGPDDAAEPARHTDLGVSGR